MQIKAPGTLNTETGLGRLGPMVEPTPWARLIQEFQVGVMTPN